MYEESLGIKCCAFMELKKTCYVLACFLLFSQTVSVVLALYLCTTNVEILRMLEESTEDFWGNVAILALAIGMILAVAIAIISFTVVLLIGLQRDDRKLIKIYLVFATFMLTISIVFCFVSEFVFVMYPTATLHRVLSVAVNAFCLYVIRNYLIKLDSNNLKLYQNEI